MYLKRLAVIAALLFSNVNAQDANNPADQLQADLDELWNLLTAEQQSRAKIYFEDKAFFIPSALLENEQPINRIECEGDYGDK